LPIGTSESSLVLVKSTAVELLQLSGIGGDIGLQRIHLSHWRKAYNSRSDWLCFPSWTFLLREANSGSCASASEGRGLFRSDCGLRLSITTALIADRKGARDVGSEEGISRGTSSTNIVERALETRYVEMSQSSNDSGSCQVMQLAGLRLAPFGSNSSQAKSLSMEVLESLCPPRSPARLNSERAPDHSLLEMTLVPPCFFFLGQC